MTTLAEFDGGFTVDAAGVATRWTVSHAVSAAYDILTDAGTPPEKAAELAVAFEVAGHDPEVMARKMLRLGAALRRGAAR